MTSPGRVSTRTRVGPDFPHLDGQVSPPSPHRNPHRRGPYLPTFSPPATTPEPVRSTYTLPVEFAVAQLLDLQAIVYKSGRSIDELAAVDELLAAAVRRMTRHRRIVSEAAA